MMVTKVRGHFKKLRGWMELDDVDPLCGSVEVTIDAGGIWTGEPERDAHLRSADFLDVEHHPEIRLTGRMAKRIGPGEYKVAGELTVRGVRRHLALDVRRTGECRRPGGRTASIRGRSSAPGSSRPGGSIGTISA